MRTTFLIQALVVFFITFGFLLLVRDLLADLEFQSFQAAEVLMVDASNILAASVEQDSEGKAEPDTSGLAASLAAARNRAFHARIFDAERKAVGMQVHVTDARGKVIYDSEDLRVGKDFSAYRDIALTLAGKYGARSSRADKDDKNSSVLHVAAPVRDGANIIGVLVVTIPQADFFPFVRARVMRTLGSAALIGSGVVLLALAVFFWLLRPIRRLTSYAQAIREGRRVPLPPLGKSREAITLGSAMENMRVELEGRAYAENYIRTLAHELKSPLAAIRGAGELLQEDLPEADRKRFLENILRETDRSESLIRQLLELARLENRPALDHSARFDLVSLCRETIDAARPRADAASVGLEFSNGPDGGISIHGDPVALRTAIANLLENAIIHSPPGKPVTLSLAGEPAEWIIRVRDLGPGVPEFATDKVFDRFYSLPHPVTGRKGTGLGLAFVREAAHLHQGTARLANHPDGGAVAEIRLPRAI